MFFSPLLLYLSKKSWTISIIYFYIFYEQLNMLRMIHHITHSLCINFKGRECSGLLNNGATIQVCQYRKWCSWIKLRRCVTETCQIWTQVGFCMHTFSGSLQRVETDSQPQQRHGTICYLRRIGDRLLNGLVFMSVRAALIGDDAHRIVSVPQRDRSGHVSWGIMKSICVHLCFPIGRRF